MDSKQPHEFCSLFDKCECNRCPLHPNFFKVQNSPEDIRYYHKCRASKPTRMKIAAQFKLKNRGLFPKEQLMIEKWENMPESEKQAKIAKLKERSLFLRLKSKGYAITPTKEEIIINPLAKTEDSPQTLNKTGDTHESKM